VYFGPLTKTLLIVVKRSYLWC